MGLRPTHRNETHLRRHPRESGGPPVDSRLRGNDVTFERAAGGQASICSTNAFKVMLVPATKYNGADG